jgi:hypothetical protein
MKFMAMARQFFAACRRFFHRTGVGVLRVVISAIIRVSQVGELATVIISVAKKLRDGILNTPQLIFVRRILFGSNRPSTTNVGNNDDKSQQSSKSGAKGDRAKGGKKVEQGTNGNNSTNIQNKINSEGKANKGNGAKNNNGIRFSLVYYVFRKVWYYIFCVEVLTLAVRMKQPNKPFNWGVWRVAVVRCG